MIRAADEVVGRRRLRVAQGDHDAALGRGDARGGDRGVEGGQVDANFQLDATGAECVESAA